MPQTKPGEAVPSVDEAANSSWYAFKHFSAGSAQDPHLSYVAGYRRAAADMLADLFQFGQYGPLTQRMLEVFEDLANQREGIRVYTDVLKEER